MARRDYEFNKREAAQLKRWAKRNGATVKMTPVEGSGNDGCCLVRLVRGERRLAIRLAQRFVKLHLGIATRQGWAY